MQTTSVRWIVCGVLSLSPQFAAGQPFPATDEIVQVLEALQRANVAPQIVCAVVILGSDGPAMRGPGGKLVQRGPKEHIAVPQGVQITKRGPEEFEIKEFESATANDPPAPAFLHQIRAFLGAAPATVSFRYAGSRFVIDGREGAVTDAEKK